MSDSALHQIMILKEIVLLTLNKQMIPLELQIDGTPIKDKEKLKEFEEELKEIKKEFVTIYDQLWATCQSQGLYVQTTRSFKFGVLHEVSLDILPIPADGNYPKEYAIVSDKEF